MMTSPSEVGESPCCLPALVAGDVGSDCLERVAAHSPRDPAIYFGPGLRVRNSIRRRTDGWTDVELDDLWPLVSAAAASHLDGNDRRSDP